MKKEPSFESYIKQRLQNHESPVPEGLWDKIAEKNSSSKSVVAWWNDQLILMLLLCALLLVGTWLITEKKQETTIAQISHSFLEGIDTNYTIPSFSETYSNSKTNDKLAIHPFSSPQQNNPSSQNTSDQKTATSLQSPANKVVKENNNQTLSPKKLFIANSNIPMVTLVTKKARKERLLTNTQTINTAAATNDASKEVNAVNNTTNSNFDKADIMSIMRTQLTFKNMKALEVRKPVLSVACPNHVNDDWFVEGYASANINIKNTVTGNENGSYLKRLDSTTSMSVGYNYGVRVSKTFGEHLLLKTGLQYTQINERFKRKTDSVVTTTRVITTRIIIRGGGLADTTVKDTSSLEQIGYIVSNTRNSLKSIEIPIIGSYETGNDKWRVGVNAGAILTLNSWYQGETFDTTYRLVPLSAQQTNGFYRTNMNVSLYAGISIYRKISNGLEAFAEPYFRYNLTNAATSGSGYSQRFNTAGLSFGLRYKLNRKSSSIAD